MKDISVIFAGDIAPPPSYHATNAAFPWFSTECTGLLGEADFAIGNLEAPLSLAATPILKSGPHIKGCPSFAQAMVDWGFSAVSLANNHILDYGAQGLLDTINACTGAKLKTVGAGANLKDAQAPLRLWAANDATLSVIAVCEHEFCLARDGEPGAAGMDPIAVHRQVRKERENCDYLIVLFHGGNEHYALPRPGLAHWARFIIDAGADAVVGSHPHVPGAVEFWKGKPIIYSLGNCLFFPNQHGGHWNRGFFVRLSFCAERDVKCRVEIFPHAQTATQGVHLLEGTERENVITRALEAGEIVGDAVRLVDAWSKFCAEQEERYLRSAFWPFRRGARSLFRSPFMRRLCLTPAFLSENLNNYRCESHREALVQILEHRLGKSK